MDFYCGCGGFKLEKARGKKPKEDKIAVLLKFSLTSLHKSLDIMMAASVVKDLGRLIFF